MKTPLKFKHNSSKYVSINKDYQFSKKTKNKININFSKYISERMICSTNGLVVGKVASYLGYIVNAVSQLSSTVGSHARVRIRG